MTDNDSGWRWAYLIPIVALMIPIVAILAGTGALDDLGWIIFAVVVLSGGTLAGRYLIDRSHAHRMEELETRRRIADLEAGQLREANRLLDRDVADLRGSLQSPPPQPETKSGSAAQAVEE